MARLIDADALLDFLDVGHLRPPTEICFSELMMKNIIDIQPTIDAVPVRYGKWIDMDEQSYTWKVRCSCCGHERSMMSTQGEYPNYCENCGARMDEE